MMVVYHHVNYVLINHQLISKLDLLHPDTMLSQRVEQKQQSQKIAHYSHKPHQEFKFGDTVYVEDFTLSSQKWIEGVITDVTGPFSYKVKLSNGTEVYNHVDSVKQRTNSIVVTEEVPILKALLLNLWLIRTHHLNLFFPHQVLPNQQNSLSCQQAYVD